MEYTVRQRMALLLEANTTAEKMTGMRDAEIDHAFLLSPPFVQDIYDSWEQDIGHDP